MNSCKFNHEDFSCRGGLWLQKVMGGTLSPHRRRWGIQQIKWLKSEIYLNLRPDAVYTAFPVQQSVPASSDIHRVQQLIKLFFPRSSDNGAAMPGLLNNQASATCARVARVLR